ncbi:MAG TPA: hypothetical protein VNH11_29205 [Pirellulales bacterium]|nr:hypothetical protein [Pirellulales bacterium]
MQSNDEAVSPEVNLLRRLASSDLSLLAAIRLFPRIDLAKKLVEACVRCDAVELVSKEDGSEKVVQPWRLRFVLNDPGTWDADGELAAVYHLRMTAEAQQRYANDSARLIQDLVQVAEGPSGGGF